MGKILRVNLSKGKITEEALDEDVARKFIGGKGLSAKILFDELKPGIDPLGPENKLVVAAGPVGAIPFSGNSRFSVCAKSPLGVGWGESYSGGYMAPKINNLALTLSSSKGPQRRLCGFTLTTVTPSSGTPRNIGA